MHAWNKDAVNLKSTVNDIMNTRAETAMSDMTADVAASMFGNTNGEVEHDEIDQEELEPAEGQ